MKSSKSFDKILFALIGIIIFIYLFSIFALNIMGRGYVNFDIYSDAILAKYMALENSLFPKGWHFGNQIYTVATPVFASFFYHMVDDSYLSLALASCFMTMLCIVSFLWCVKPYAKTKSIIVSLLVLLGGTNIGLTAHGDIEGFQVFYTMASYYACYVIGIFATLGVYFRYIQDFPVNKIILFIVLALNCALGMQSLREMLILNLPLCAIALLNTIFNIKKSKQFSAKCRNAFLFVFSALFANLVGIILNKLLIANGTIIQNDILKEITPHTWDNVTFAAKAFLQYINLVIPTSFFSAFQSTVALISIVIVVVTLSFILSESIKGNTTNIALGILFFTVSLLAVFMAGVVFISLRPIYYFCWYLLLSFCVIYLIDLEWYAYKKLLESLKYLLAVGLLGISIVNYSYTFVISFKGLEKTKDYYSRIVNQLHTDEIKYVYSDWRTEQDMISSISKDEIIYVTLSFSNNSMDLWEPIDYLYMDSWFDTENFDDAYIVLSDTSLMILNHEFSPEYVDTLMANLELVYEFANAGDSVYFYRGTEKLYNDMRN